MLNSAIKNNIFSSKLKHGKVSPIFKSVNSKIKIETRYLFKMIRLSESCYSRSTTLVLTNQLQQIIFFNTMFLG